LALSSNEYKTAKRLEKDNWLYAVFNFHLSLKTYTGFPMKIDNIPVINPFKTHIDRISAVNPIFDKPSEFR